MNIEIPKITCKRCSHKWTPRKPTVITCPKCKSPYFDKERTNLTALITGATTPKKI